MKKTIKTTSLVLTLLMLISVFAVAPITAGALTCGDYSYIVLEDGTAEIIGYNADDDEVIIPSELDGYTVTVIGNTDYDEVYGAFEFEDVVKVTIPNTVTTIKDFAFYVCENLSSLTIPDSVTSIGKGAFEWCESLTSINIPKDVMEIGENAFLGCKKLSSFDVDEDNQYYTSVNGVLYNKDKTTLIQYPLAKADASFVVPESVETIESFAFDQCENIENITLSEKVDTIGDSAFRYCSNLKSINVEDNNSTFSSINGNLYNKEKTTLFMYSIGKNDESFTVPDGVLRINEKAFSDCKTIKEMIISDSVTDIGDNAFSDCTNLLSVIIPYGVTSIGKYAFGSCESLQSITMPDSITSLGDYAFAWCKNLKSVKLSKGLSTIEHSAFEKCRALESITIHENIDTIGYYAFDGCESLKSINIPDSVSQIRWNAFDNCPNLISVTFGEGISYIDEEAFGYYTDEEGEKAKNENLVIKGYSGTAAQRYANENEFTFVSLGGGSTKPAKTDISGWIVSGIKNKTYTGKAIKQSITVKKGTKKATVSVKYKNNTNAGKATAIITGTGNYTGTITKTFMISKAKNPMTLGYKKSVTANSKKKTTIKKAVTANKAQGKVTYKTNNKKVTVKNGTMTVAKGLKKGKTISVKVTVTAKGNSNYKSASKSVTVKVKVK